MNYEYVLSETVYHNGKYTRKTFGIAAVSMLDTITVIEEIIDISDDKKYVENLIKLCNKGKLELEHLQNIVYDLL